MSDPIPLVNRGPSLLGEVREVIEEHWKDISTRDGGVHVPAPFSMDQVHVDEYVGGYPAYLRFELLELHVPCSLMIYGREFTNEVWSSFRFTLQDASPPPEDMALAERLSLPLVGRCEELFAWAADEGGRFSVHTYGVDGRVFGWDTPMTACETEEAVQEHVTRLLKTNATAWEFALLALLEERPELTGAA